MAHIRELMKAGEEVKIVDNAGNEFPIWVMRPSSTQQDRARELANGKMARMKLKAMDEKGDKYAALKLAFAEIKDHDELVESRVKYDDSGLRDLAFNEVLYGTGEEGEEESKWIKDETYFSLIQAITDRMEEILRYNEEMESAGSEDRMSQDTDPEMVKLLAEQQKFRAEVEDRTVVHEKAATEEHYGKTNKALRKELLEYALDLEAKMGWYEAFQNQMVYYASRYIDDKKKFYFLNAEEVLEIPDYVRTQLYSAYERVEQGSDDLKNLLSPPSS